MVTHARHHLLLLLKLRWWLELHIVLHYTHQLGPRDKRTKKAYYAEFVVGSACLVVHFGKTSVEDLDLDLDLVHALESVR